MRTVLVFFLTLILSLNIVYGTENAMDQQYDYSEILQPVIDAKELLPYYHADILPDRIPLRLLRNIWVSDGKKLHKFGRDVEFLASPVGNLPYMSISDIRISEGVATVSFEYPPEGLAGTARLSNQRGVWSLSSIILHEK